MPGNFDAACKQLLAADPKGFLKLLNIHPDLCEPVSTDLSATQLQADFAVKKYRIN